MRKFRLVSVWIMGLLIAVSACHPGPSSSINKKKQIKKGKPIPCPVKDC